MKKLFILSVAMLATTFVQAQITLEHTFSGTLFFANMYESRNLMDDVIMVEADEKSGNYDFYDATTYTQVASVSSPNYGEIYLASKGLFTTDNTIAFVVLEFDNSLGWYDNSKLHYYVKNVMGVTICDLGTSAGVKEGVFLIKLGNVYKLAVKKAQTTPKGTDEYNNPIYDYEDVTEIYSIPGSVTALPAPAYSDSRHSARKIAREGQVFIQSDDNTYTITATPIQ